MRVDGLPRGAERADQRRIALVAPCDLAQVVRRAARLCAFLGAVIGDRFGGVRSPGQRVGRGGRPADADHGVVDDEILDDPAEAEGLLLLGGVLRQQGFIDGRGFGDLGLGALDHLLQLVGVAGDTLRRRGAVGGFRPQHPVELIDLPCGVGHLAGGERRQPGLVPKLERARLLAGAEGVVERLLERLEALRQTGHRNFVGGVPKGIDAERHLLAHQIERGAGLLAGAAREARAELVDLGAHIGADDQVERRQRVQPRQFGDGDVGPQQRRPEQAVIDGAGGIADGDVVAHGPDILRKPGIESLVGRLVVEPAQRVVLQLAQRRFAGVGSGDDGARLDPQHAFGSAGRRPFRLCVQDPALGRKGERHVRRVGQIERVRHDLHRLILLRRRIYQRDRAIAGETNGIAIELDRAIGQPDRHRHHDLARIDADFGDAAQRLPGLGRQGGEQARRQLDDVAGDAIGVPVAILTAPDEDFAILAPESRRIDQFGILHHRRDATVQRGLRERGRRVQRDREAQCDRERRSGTPQDPLDLERGDAVAVIHRDSRA